MIDQKKSLPRCQPGTGDVSIEQGEVIVSGPHGKLPFIPAWLDDAGLSQAEFRLYCHLCRRADKQGVAWPSYQSIMDACGFSHKTVWRITRDLEARGLIVKVGKPFGGSCRYRISVPTMSLGERLENSNHVTGGTIEPPIVSQGESLKAPQSFPSGNSNRSPEETPIVSPGEREGSPKKVIQRKVPNVELLLVGESLPFESAQFRAAWESWERHRREIKKKLTPESIRQQFRKFATMGESRSIAAIDHSIANGWQGIFEPKADPATAPRNRELTSSQVGI